MMTKKEEQKGKEVRVFDLTSTLNSQDEISQGTEIKLRCGGVTVSYRCQNPDPCFVVSINDF